MRIVKVGLDKGMMEKNKRRNQFKLSKKHFLICNEFLILFYYIEFWALLVSMPTMPKGFSICPTVCTPIFCLIAPSPYQSNYCLKLPF